VAAPKTSDNLLRLNRSGMMTMSRSRWSQRQAAMLAARMRHPAGKAIPPSAEVRTWAEQESTDLFQAEHGGNGWN
jgi:hypothetical protein